MAFNPLAPTADDQQQRMQKRPGIVPIVSPEEQGGVAPMPQQPQAPAPAYAQQVSAADAAPSRDVQMAPPPPNMALAGVQQPQPHDFASDDTTPQPQVPAPNLPMAGVQPPAPYTNPHIQAATDWQHKIDANSEPIHPHGIHRALNILAGLGMGALTFNPLVGVNTTKQLDHYTGAEGRRRANIAEYSRNRENEVDLAKQQTSEDKVEGMRQRYENTIQQQQQKIDENARHHQVNESLGDRRVTNAEESADTREDQGQQRIDQGNTRNKERAHHNSVTESQGNQRIEQGKQRIAASSGGKNGLSAGANRALKADPEAMKALDDVKHADQVINSTTAAEEEKAAARKDREARYSVYKSRFDEYAQRDQKGEWGDMGGKKKPNPFHGKTSSTTPDLNNKNPF